VLDRLGLDWKAIRFPKRQIRQIKPKPKTTAETTNTKTQAHPDHMTNRLSTDVPEGRMASSLA